METENNASGTMENADGDELSTEDVLEVIDDENNGVSVDDGEEEEATSTLADEIEDCAQSCFNGHSAGVFCVDASAQLAVSGGEDDQAYLWTLADGIQRMHCDGHTDSVTHVRFNPAGTLLATGDLGGRIQIWDVATLAKVAEYTEASGDLEWLQWHHSANCLLAGAGDGLIWLWLVPTDNFKLYTGHGPRCLAGRLLPDGKRLLAGYEDGVVRLWSLKETTSVVITGASVAVLGAILSLDCHPAQPLGACGTQSGTVAVFQTDSAKFTSVFEVKPLSTEDDAAGAAGDDDETTSSGNSIETVAFCPFVGQSFSSSMLLASGSVQGRLNIWDISSRQCRQDVPHPAGIVKLLWLSADMVVSSCLDGVVRVVDARDGALVRSFTGHRAEILDICIATDPLRIVSSSEDGTCRVFELTD